MINDFLCIQEFGLKLQILKDSHLDRTGGQFN